MTDAHQTEIAESLQEPVLPQAPASLITVTNLVKHFDISGGFLDQLSISRKGITRRQAVVHAVNNVSFDVHAGETLAIVGESGCGKSTLARTVIRLHKPTSGEIYYRDARIDCLSDKELIPYRRKMQMVFQDPYASLNPRMRVGEILEEPVHFHHPELSQAEVTERVHSTMAQVGIDTAWATRYPHEFSGGQRQRISLARALVLDPECIVADEPISALDVSIQAQVLNLMMDMQDSRGLTYLFISHDLSVVEHISTRVAVMYLGSMCELAPSVDLFAEPRHPYTKALLSAIPEISTNESKRIKLTGEVPTPINLPSGCVFHGRCPHVMPVCKEIVPSLALYGHSFIACHAVAEGKI